MMKITQSTFSENSWTNELSTNDDVKWLLMFGSRKLAADPNFRKQIQESYPNAFVMGCSTSGEIAGDRLFDNAMVCTAVSFDSSSIEAVSLDIADYENSNALGKAAIQQLPQDGLRHVFVISNGHSINGTELVEGLQSALGQGVSISGGLAGDDDRFEETIVWFQDKIGPGLVVLAGLYGPDLELGCGHLGGWNAFGPIRTVTKSVANVVFEIDNKPALTLYKEFLGEFASGLPASALLYPLAIQYEGQQAEVVRTILSINEEDNSMLFAGNVQQGAEVRLMHASYEDLLDGAEGAVASAKKAFGAENPQLSLLVSCVGRRLVLGQRSEEELEVISEYLPASCVTTGFYSYGEISPIQETGKAALHNQTMTVTLLSEKA
jgi:hypothetical protein